LISKIITKAQKAVAKANDLKDLDDARVLYLGKKGELTALLKGLGKLSKEERPVMGEAINEAKVEIQKLIESRKGELEEIDLEKRILEEKIDVTYQVEILRRVAYTQSLRHLSILKTFSLRVVLR